MNIVKKLFRPRIVERIKIDLIDYNDLIERGVLIIDVSDPKDYWDQHIPDSLNIRLSKLHKFIEELSNASRPILLVSTDGKKGDKARKILKSYKIECYHGGKTKHNIEMLEKHQDIDAKLHPHIEEVFS